MMENINIPPFCVGQKVVCINSRNCKFLTLGKDYIVKELKYACCGWEIFVGFTADGAYQTCSVCGAIEFQKDGKVWYKTVRFAPSQEKFQSITLEKILEEETKYISVN